MRHGPADHCDACRWLADHPGWLDFDDRLDDPGLDGLFGDPADAVALAGDSLPRLLDARGQIVAAALAMAPRGVRWTDHDVEQLLVRLDQVAPGGVMFVELACGRCGRAGLGGGELQVLATVVGPTVAPATSGEDLDALALTQLELFDAAPPARWRLRCECGAEHVLRVERLIDRALTRAETRRAVRHRPAPTTTLERRTWSAAARDAALHAMTARHSRTAVRAPVVSMWVGEGKASRRRGGPDL